MNNSQYIQQSTVQFDQSNPILWLQWVKSTTNVTTEQIYEILSTQSNSIVRISKNEFSSAFLKIDINILNELRLKLSSQLLVKFPQVVLRKRKIPKILADDCYDIIMMLVNNQLCDNGRLNEIYTKTSQAANTINDNIDEFFYLAFEEMRLNFDHLKEENKNLLAKVNESFEKYDLLLNSNSNLVIEINKIKSMLTANCNKANNGVQTPTVAPSTSQFSQSNTAYKRKRLNDELSSVQQAEQQTNTSKAASSKQQSVQQIAPQSPANKQSTSKQPVLKNTPRPLPLAQKQIQNFESTASNFLIPNEVNCWSIANKRNQPKICNKSIQNNNNRSNNNNNNNSNYTRNNSKHQNNHNKLSQTQRRDNKWLKSCGSNSDTPFPVQHRPFSVYFGRGDNSCTVETVKNWLKMKNITHFNLKELTDKNHNSFKSFVFDISFLDRDIIYDKNLWPRGIQIGKFKKKYIQPVNQASALTSNSAPISKKMMKLLMFMQRAWNKQNLISSHNDSS